MKSNQEIDSLKSNKTSNNKKPFNNLSEISKTIKKEVKINKLRIIINTIICIFILVLTYFVINNYEEQWQIAFYLTLWSFFMNLFYIINSIIIDIIRYKKKYDYCTGYNNIIRNNFLRICFPFAFSIVFLFWTLILLGDDFQFNSRSLFDYLVNFAFHGLQLILLLFDTLTYPHTKDINKKLDVLVISIMVVIYFIILGFGKYMNIYEPYDFMSMSNIRQIAGAAFLIYIGILDGYVVFVLIAGKCFVDKEINISEIKEKVKKEKNNNNNNNKKKIRTNNKNENFFNKIENGKNINTNNIEDKNKKNIVEINKITRNKNSVSNEEKWEFSSNEKMSWIIPPIIQKKKLKPIEFNKKDNK